MTRKRKRESDVASVSDPISVPEDPPAQEVEYVPETPPPPDSGGEDEVEGMLGRPGPDAALDEVHLPPPAGNASSGVPPDILDLEHMNLQYPSSGPPSPQPMDVDDPPLSGTPPAGEPVGAIDVDEDVTAAVAPSQFYGPATESRHAENGGRNLLIDEGQVEGSSTSTEADKR